MRGKFLNMTIGLSALLLCATAQAPVFAEASPGKEPVIGQTAPALAATQLDGKTFDIAAEKGKVVVVHFWATWCGACREEMPALEAVWRQYKGSEGKAGGLDIIAVSADRPRQRGEVEQVMHYFTFPAAMMEGAAKNDFGTPSMLPITYVIDKEGKLQNVMTPDILPLTEQTLGNIVKPLLDAKVEEKTEAKSDKKADEKTESKSQ